MEIRKETVLILLELGIIFGLCFLLLWGGPISALAPLNASYAEAYSLGVNCGFAGAFGLLGLFSRIRRIPDTTLVACCGVLSLMGFCSPALLDSYSQVTPLTLGIGAFVSGLSEAGFLFAALRHLAGTDEKQRNYIVAGAALIGLGVYAIVSYLIPDNVKFLVVCLFFVPALAIISYISSRKSLQAAPEGPIAFNRHMVQILVSAILLGFGSTVLIQMGDVAQTQQMAIAGITGAVLVLFFLIKRRFPQTLEVYLLAFPLLATLMLLFPFGGAFVQKATIFAGNVAAELLLFSVLIQPVPETKLYSPAFVACLLCAFHLSVIAGASLGPITASLFDTQSSWMVGLVYVSLYLLSVFAFSVLFARRKEEGASLFSGAAPDSAERVQPAQDLSAIRCHAAATRFSLSQREEEILDLLLKGRDVPAIANLLHISQNTVRFHTKNLYMRMGVHTKQELIDLVESLAP
ncbi:MAG: hypothetical protein IKD70_05460 [Eggerthellaceae bacterium]|nr:hypothetical protein [Eggerthellaceae bacterium]